MNADQFKAFMAMQTKILEQLTAPNVGHASTTAATSSNEQLIASLNARIMSFQYVPDENLTFEAWYDRYGVCLTEDGSSLTEQERVRLLVENFRQQNFNDLPMQ